MLHSQIEIFHWLLNNKRQHKTQGWLFVSGFALLNLGLNARLCLLDLVAWVRTFSDQEKHCTGRDHGATLKVGGLTSDSKCVCVCVCVCVRACRGEGAETLSTLYTVFEKVGGGRA